MKIDSQIQLGTKLPLFSVNKIKNEPMFFNAGPDFVYRNAGPLTRAFLEGLSDEFLNSPDLVIDSRTHMLMPGWYPCIPGWHHDDVPRERSDGQPEYNNPSYKSKHALAVYGDCSITEFALGSAEFEDVPLGEKYYKVWNDVVDKMVHDKVLESLFIPSEQVIYFDWHSWHRGSPATKDGWRTFIRASIQTGRKPTNEIRNQTQVYMPILTEGW